MSEVKGEGTSPKYNYLYGSPGQARTADLVINSHPLYRLSYRGIAMFSEGGMIRKLPEPVNCLTLASGPFPSV